MRRAALTFTAPTFTALALAVLTSGVLVWAAPAGAQSALPKPWQPAARDTILSWAIEGRNMLAESKSPELGDREVVAYRYVDKVAKSYFHALGPNGMAAAGGVEAFLDSLKLEGKLVQDEEYPAFAIVLFSNPSHENYASLGYLYWFRGNEVRSQPLNFKGGHDPQLRVWWTGREAAPWQAAILYSVGRDLDSGPELILLSMVPTGAGWEPVQAGAGDVDLGGKGIAHFADLDRDDVPEVVSWTRGIPDSLFVPCNELGCPELYTERTFVLERGFELYDQRTVATPFAALVLFVRALASGQEGLVQSLVTKPTVVAKARELGWARLRRPGVFRTLAPRGGTRWPDRLRFEYGPKGVFDTFLEVRFASSNGHWLLDDIVVLRSGGTPADTTRGAATPAPSARQRTNSSGSRSGGH